MLGLVVSFLNDSDSTTLDGIVICCVFAFVVVLEAYAVAKARQLCSGEGR